jgi:catechol 2,3-dioxygenase-like lactoylglutathione lyase family enzyme
MKFVCSLIVVENIERAKHFYSDILKQHVISDFGENVGYEGGFAIHKKEHFKKLINDKEIMRGSNSFELYFEEDNLEPLEKELKKNGIEFIHEIREQPWKQRVMRFYDYDKNIIEVGERLEHVAYRLYKEKNSFEEIEKTTYLDKDRIELAINEYSKKELS